MAATPKEQFLSKTLTSPIQWKGPNIIAKRTYCQQRGVWTIRTISDLNEVLEEMVVLQKEFSTWTQERVDKLVEDVRQHIKTKQYWTSLAEYAEKETEMGRRDHKLIKNMYAGYVVPHAYKDVKTCGKIKSDPINGVDTYGAPMGIIAGFVPATNPTATTLYKTFMALKSRNAIVFSPNKTCERSCYETACVLAEAIEQYGGPRGIIAVVDQHTVDQSTMNAEEKKFHRILEPLMAHPLIDIVFMTGGTPMVKKAYSCGKPSLGVGAGNVPVIIDKTADLPAALEHVRVGKTFDNGLLCMSEEVLIVYDDIYEDVKAMMRQANSGYHLLSTEDRTKVGNCLLMAHEKLIGKNYEKICETAHVKSREPEGRELRDFVMVGEITLADKRGPIPDDMIPDNFKTMTKKDDKEWFMTLTKEQQGNLPWLSEKMAPVIGLLKVHNDDQAFDAARRVLKLRGEGHSAIMHTDYHHKDNKKRMDRAGIELPVGRVTVNQPGCFGTIGGILNFGVDPTMSIGCGSWGGNSTSENISPKHLINTKTVAVHTEEVRLTRKAVTLMTPQPEKLRAAFEAFVVCLEASHALRNTKTSDMVKDEYKNVMRDCFKYLGTVKPIENQQEPFNQFNAVGPYELHVATDPDLHHDPFMNLMTNVNEDHGVLQEALDSYSKHLPYMAKLGEKDSFFSTQVHALSRSTNISFGYLLAVMVEFMITSEKHGKWDNLEKDLDCPGLGNTRNETLNAITDIILRLHAYNDILPDPEKPRFGLHESRFNKVKAYTERPDEVVHSKACTKVSNEKDAEKKECVKECRSIGLNFLPPTFLEVLRGTPDVPRIREWRTDENRPARQGSDGKPSNKAEKPLWRRMDSIDQVMRASSIDGQGSMEFLIQGGMP